MQNEYSGISLFSCSGIGDLGFQSAGIKFRLMCEVESDRAQLASINFPQAKIIDDDICINVDHIVDYCTKNCDELFLIACTAPCQGMSKSGQGTLLKNIREGKRPKLDPRNRLILPALRVIKKLRPKFVVFENVCEMRNTVIEDENKNIRPILEIIHETLANEYLGEAYDVEFANYGVPQRRKRLITVYTRDNNAKEYFEKGGKLVPLETHAQNIANNKKSWVSVKSVLEGFPKLDAGNKIEAESEEIPFHRVPLLDKKKYNWVSNTPTSKSAFDNQCINPDCNHQGNLTHGTKKNNKGINQSKKDTPLYCSKCGSLLPRPYVEEDDGALRIMSGYTSAYKRMDPDSPSPAITRNFSFACSDNKLHPYENRVLSLAEAFKLQTLDRYEYNWGPIQNKNGKILDVATDTLIRVVLGECIPPYFTELLGKHLINLMHNKVKVGGFGKQLEMY